MANKKRASIERINPKLIEILDVIKESAEKLGIPEYMNSRNFQSGLLADQLRGLKFEVSINPKKGVMIKDLGKTNDKDKK